MNVRNIRGLNQHWLMFEEDFGLYKEEKQLRTLSENVWYAFAIREKLYVYLLLRTYPNSGLNLMNVPLILLVWTSQVHFTLEIF